MTIARTFPVAMMVLSVCATAAYGFEGDWRRAAYWAFATGLTAAATF